MHYSLNDRNVNDFSLMTYKFFNIPLLYAYDALEPYIDKKTMELHHDRHLQTYINNLNSALEPYPVYQNWPLTKLLADLKLFRQPLQTQIQKNAGGVYNHFFYFDGLTDKYKMPQGKILQLLNAEFGSLNAFSAALKESALSVFGSGYAWLILNEHGNAEIVTTSNQDCPISDNLYPLLNVDMWEHAYYLLHYNDRSAYLDNFMKVINWKIIELRLNDCMINSYI